MIGHPRFFVPDLTPVDRPELSGSRPRLIFVAESPHTSEVAPSEKQARRPLCGMAGRKWWSLLGEILENDPSEDVSLDRMIRLCRQHRIAVMNAVQFPLDTAICKTVPEADPVRHLKFCKNPGPHSYKKLKKSPAVSAALGLLRGRLRSPELSDLPIYCLGNDALWFVARALDPVEFKRRFQDRLPHPSAWWRKGGAFGRIARDKLQQIFI